MDHAYHLSPLGKYLLNNASEDIASLKSAITTGAATSTPRLGAIARAFSEGYKERLGGTGKTMTELKDHFRSKGEHYTHGYLSGLGMENLTRSATPRTKARQLWHRMTEPNARKAAMSILDEYAGRH